MDIPEEIGLDVSAITETDPDAEFDATVKLRLELRPELELELKPRLDPELKPGLELGLKPELELGLEPELDAGTDVSLVVVITAVIPKLLVSVFVIVFPDTTVINPNSLKVTVTSTVCGFPVIVISLVIVFVTVTGGS